MNYPDEIEILKDFIDILDDLDIRYALSGSLASSFYGKVRFTEDADITVEPFESSAKKLFILLRPDYYISENETYEALKNHTSFNVLHIESCFKIDVSVSKDTAFEKQIFLRRRAVKLGDNIQKPFAIVSGEDVILIKLGWFRESGQTSEKQWSDILGVLSVQAERLDYNYLNKCSAELGLNDLLKKALTNN